MKTVNTTLIILLAAFISACGEQSGEGLEALKSKRDSLKAAKTELTSSLVAVEAKIAEMDTTVERRLTPITVSEPKQGRFEHFFKVQGNVETDKDAMLYPEAQGRILKIHKKEGEKVTKGEVIISLDSRVLQNGIDELKSRLELAETVFKKQERLWKKNIGSEIQYLEAKNNRDALQKNLETMQSQLDMYKVKAPFTGILDDIMPKMGEMASPMAPVARVLNLDEVYMDCDVTESYLGKIKEGDSVMVGFPSLGVKYKTTISRIGKYINPNNRTFKVTVTIKNKNEVLRPNLIGEVNIRDYVADSSIMISQSLVLQDTEGKEFVYITRSNKGNSSVVKRYIETGLSYQGMQLIKKGLKEGDYVVDEGSRSIKDGEEVQIISNISYEG